MSEWKPVAPNWKPIGDLATAILEDIRKARRD